MTRYRGFRCFFVLVLFAAVAAFSPLTSAGTTCAPGGGFCTPSPVVVYANPHWSIQLTSFGYSDFVIYQLPPFPRWDPRDPTGAAPIHEMFSGEWAFAIRYNGTVIWLEPCFLYPDWATNSNFIVEVPISFTTDTDGDGVLEGTSVISNGTVRITIEYDFDLATDGTDYGTAMGLGVKGTMADPFRLSDRWVLFQRFAVENISGSMLSNVSLYTMAAVHPGNTEYAGISGAYDWTLHSSGGFQDYFWDVTAFATNSGLTDGFPTGSMFDDAVSYSINTLAGAWDIDIYPGHQFGDDGLTTDPNDANMNGLKPLSGTHCNIENQALNNVTHLTDVEFAAGYRLDGGDLAAAATWLGDVMLAVDSKPIGQPAEACGHLQETGGDPVLTMSKGPCPASNPTMLTYDIAMGSKYDLSRVPSCGTGPKGEFDCTALIDLECKARQHAMDNIPLIDDAHVSDMLVYLARPSQVFGSYGMGRNLPGNPNELWRFYFTSATAPIDVCGPDASPMGESVQSAPGVGKREAVGLGVPVPVRENGLP
ncbi:MAG: hypothetical protein GTN89_10180 [Acidobacteria bacterium]|nr:hypothetical protein [Acidobacteriota bacterium]NIM61412.1 hypothetical protein [Acidobacteriota bacterium]NIO59623.1 hypothetical protein [Acidobacteriota bacterium]NIQ30720.1 hypothetical protein [Acidobacteriota bacterium]NIQ85716.1 hypothetical protein [Acidobacteriota bacterium]